MKMAIYAGLVASVAASGASALTYNDGGSILRALSGNSVIGQLSDGISYCEYHAPNSGVFGRDTEVYAGNWGVWENYVCYTYPGMAQDCQRALMDGNRITFMDANNGSLVATGTIVQGNICS